MNSDSTRIYSHVLHDILYKKLLGLMKRNLNFLQLELNWNYSEIPPIVYLSPPYLLERYHPFSNYPRLTTSFTLFISSASSKTWSISLMRQKIPTTSPITSYYLFVHAILVFIIDEQQSRMRDRRWKEQKFAAFVRVWPWAIAIFSNSSNSSFSIIVDTFEIRVLIIAIL